jgi:hypothetical protein
VTDPPQVPRPGLLQREWPFIVVAAGIVLGLVVVVALDRFRRGTLLLAASVVLGAWLRALLPTERVGVLAVRGRLFDVVTLLVLGGALTVLALVVPSPS